ncbi:MAG: hypothetical protein K6B44_04930 [Lachnospiraceae bacterium]|nr:hypothetical protein [Lachnospiraceae bacterium]
MKVWRIHIKPDIEAGFSRRDLLEFLKKEEIIGVGWSEIKTRENSAEAIRKEAVKYDDPSSAIKALNALRNMQIGDLIWTRLDNEYYLCQVTDLWENSKPSEMHRRFDVTNYVSVKWSDIGLETKVPGKVLSSFRPPASAQSVSGVEDISMYLWNKYSDTDAYDIRKDNIDFWTVLSSEAIEELVLLYLQVEKGFYIYSTSVKYAFPTYECEMANIMGIRCYPQVKSGDVPLNADDYMQVLQNEPDSNVYLFSQSESYTENNDKRVKYIYKKDIEEFVRRHKMILPDMTYGWIDLCGFFDR